MGCFLILCSKEKVGCPPFLFWTLKVYWSSSLVLLWKITAKSTYSLPQICFLTLSDTLFDKGTATDINVFLLVVGCSVPSIRLDVTWWMAACAGVWVSKVPSCWRLPILLLWGVSGINCMSGWLADCGLFTMIPASCKLFWTAAAMVIPKFANQSALTLLAPCAGGGFAPDGLCKFSCAAECAVSWLGWGLFPSTRRLWEALVT